MFDGDLIKGMFHYTYSSSTKNVPDTVLPDVEQTTKG